jgi:hypothetical protein
VGQLLIVGAGNGGGGDYLDTRVHTMIGLPTCMNHLSHDIGSVPVRGFGDAGMPGDLRILVEPCDVGESAGIRGNGVVLGQDQPPSTARLLLVIGDKPFSRLAVPARSNWSPS